MRTRVRVRVRVSARRQRFRVGLGVRVTLIPRSRCQERFTAAPRVAWSLRLVSMSMKA